MRASAYVLIGGRGDAVGGRPANSFATPPFQLPCVVIVSAFLWPVSMLEQHIKERALTIADMATLQIGRGLAKRLLWFRGCLGWWWATSSGEKGLVHTKTIDS